MNRESGRLELAEFPSRAAGERADATGDLRGLPHNVGGARAAPGLRELIQEGLASGPARPLDEGDCERDRRELRQPAVPPAR
jgi:hypothetical protein